MERFFSVASQEAILVYGQFCERMDAISVRNCSSALSFGRRCGSNSIRELCAKMGAPNHRQPVAKRSFSVSPNRCQTVVRWASNRCQISSVLRRSRLRVLCLSPRSGASADLGEVL